jgi:hypothetical protein
MEQIGQALASTKEVARLVSKNNETEDEKDNSFQAQFKAAVKTQQTKDLSEKTFGQLTPSQIDSARMSETSYINLVDGPHSAQKYAKMHLPDYKWDRIRSTEHIAVFVNKKTGKVRLGFRGTQTLVDWKMNGRILTGTLGQSSQIKEMDKTINEIFDFYGRDENGKQTMVEIMSGHSKGGGGAYYFGELYGVDTHLQDPAIPANEIFGGKTKAVHHVARTPGDVVSALSNVAVFRKGINITDLKQKNEGALKAHELSIMSQTDYEKTGNTVYNPKLKSQAFLLQQLNKGKSTEEIVKEVGYSSKESRQELREEIKAIQATPETHEKVLKDSGFAIKQKPTSIVGKAKASIGELVVNKVVPKIDGEIGKAVDRVAKVASAGGIAGILSAVGTSQALAAVGSTNEVVNEGVIGAVSNASQDAAASAYAHVRNRGHHVPVTNALRNLPNGSVDSLIAESTSGAVRTAEQVSSASRMAAMGTRALASLAKGGVGGIIGAGVQIGAQAALEAMGMDAHTASQVSRLAGAAAGGAMFGPQAVVIFVAIEAFTIAFEEIWNFFSPHEPEISPYEREREEIRLWHENEGKKIIADNAETMRLADIEYMAKYGMGLREYQANMIATKRQEVVDGFKSDGMGHAQAIWENVSYSSTITWDMTPAQVNLAIRNYVENESRNSENHLLKNYKRYMYDAVEYDSKDIPQLDNNGILVIRNYSQSGVEIEGDPTIKPPTYTAVPQWVRWEELTSAIPEIITPPEYELEEAVPPKLYEDMTPEEQELFVENGIAKQREINAEEDVEYEDEDEETEALDSDEYEDYNSDPGDEEVVEEEVVEVEVPPPVADLATEHIYSTRQGILNTINNDAKIKELRRVGDTHGVNKSIRELFMKNSHSSEYNGVTNYGDPQLPQLTPNNELIYQTFSAPTPTTETAKQEQENNNI